MSNEWGEEELMLCLPDQQTYKTYKSEYAIHIQHQCKLKKKKEKGLNYGFSPYSSKKVRI